MSPYREGSLMPDDEVSTNNGVSAPSVSLPSRRSLLKMGGAAALGVGAYALAACESSTAPGTSGQAAGESSVLDKWISTKTAKLGVDLTFPPIQFKDSSGKPT